MISLAAAKYSDPGGTPVIRTKNGYPEKLPVLDSHFGTSSNRLVSPYTQEKEYRISYFFPRARIRRTRARSIDDCGGSGPDRFRLSPADSI